MNESGLFNEPELLELMSRSRTGFKAFCATVDLLGMKTMIRENPIEASSRLNDLQQGFGDAFLLFPGGTDYRVCFAGDSVFVVKELAPEESWIERWPDFCGHVFALASVMQDLEVSIGNPGIRLIISYGQLFQLRQPDSWREESISEYTRNWLVLTGASDALVKCTEAERLGQNGGFDGGYCWHEDTKRERSYLGTRLFRIPTNLCRLPDLYPTFYQEVRARTEKQTELVVGE